MELRPKKILWVYFCWAPFGYSFSLFGLLMLGSLLCPPLPWGNVCLMRARRTPGALL